MVTCGILCVQDLALDAVQTVARDVGGGQREVDIKNYAKIEKIPGGTIEDCKVSQAEAVLAILSTEIVPHTDEGECATVSLYG